MTASVIVGGRLRRVWTVFASSIVSPIEYFERDARISSSFMERKSRVGEFVFFIEV
jgi:hypothetical protein